MVRQPDLASDDDRMREAKRNASASRRARNAAEAALKAGDPSMVRAASYAAERFNANALALLKDLRQSPELSPGVRGVRALDANKLDAERRKHGLPTRDELAAQVDAEKRHTKTKSVSRRAKAS